MGKATEGMIEIATDIAEELCLMDELEEILDSEDNFYDVSDFIDEYKYKYLKMDNMKDKLIEIAKREVACNATEFSNGRVLLFGGNDFDHACEAIADEIMENLPELLADSEWVRIPAKIGDTIYFTCGDEIKSIVVRKIRLNGSNYITYFGREPNDKSHKTINVYEDNRITEAEAEAKLAELKGAKK